MARARVRGTLRDEATGVPIAGAAVRAVAESGHGVGPLASTLIACLPPADQIERDFVSALGRVRGWRLDERQLILVDDACIDVLRFVEGTLET